MKLSQKQRLVLSAAALFGIGLLAGVILIAEFSNIPISSVFAQGVKDLGAKQPPVKVPENVRALNDAFVTVANAVSPTVVFIEVMGTTRSTARDFDDFFRFYLPWGEEFFFGPRDEERQPKNNSPRQRPLGNGSGVVLTNDGYIVTNNHVISGAKSDGIRVVLHDKREFTAKLIGKDSLTDLAVIKIDADNLPAAYLGNRENIRVGEWVVAVGNPLGLRSTITTGIISATGRGGLGLNRGQFAIENYIQTDAAINPGNSGGGLFTLNGELIGINTAIASGTGFYAGYGFAIPVDIVRTVVLDLINTGKVNRAYIGVTIRAVDETDAKAVGLSKIEGVLVQDVLENSPASKADVRSGDVILDLDGTSVNSPNQLQTLVLQRKPGDKVKIRIWRDGKVLVKDVRLEARDGSVASADRDLQERTDEVIDSREPVSFDELGFSVAPLSSELKDKLSVSNGVQVTGVEPYSEAYQRGLIPNSVIVKIDRKPIETLTQFRSILKEKKPGEVILMEVKTSQGRQIISMRIPAKAN